MAPESQSTERSATPSSSTHPQDKVAVRGNRGVKVVRSCTVRKPASELYQFWRSLENLPRVVQHPMSINRLSDTESHWKVSAPAIGFVEWDAVIINDGSVIAQGSLPELQERHQEASLESLFLKLTARPQQV